ncbi:MAG: type VI secretion system ATPase TssH, partial [Janthinobacterium lividum]
MSLNLKSLIGKLNEPTRNMLEAAAGLCVSRTHYDIEIEHFLLKAIETGNNDVTAICRHFGLETARLSSSLQRSLDGFKAGNARSPAFSPSLVKVLLEGWTVASIEYGASKVRTGHLVLALVGNEDLARLMRESAPELRRVEAEALRTEFATITSSSPEAAGSRAGTDGEAAAEAEGSRGAETAGGATPAGKTPYLDQYTVDLTANARAGRIDPVLGRDAEVRQMVDILMRRRQNNPILTGEAGVGKTAVVEGFANRVAAGDVPPALQGVHVRTLDLALLQAGASVKGEFENRLKGLIKEVRSSPEPIILFIDEAHTMIGSGGQAGQNDAANLLKPALARGELRTIAATTWSEYKKYFEKDPALSRRFQVVKVEEPTEEVCCTMLRGLAGTLERHHGLRIRDEAIIAATKLSHRYLAGRQLPDKAVSVLDTACARLALTQNAQPAALEEVTRTIDALETRQRILLREAALGVDHAEPLTEIETQLAKGAERREVLTRQWQAERELVAEIRALQAKLEEREHGLNGAGGAAVSSTDLQALEEQLATLQGETPMVRVAVDASVVAEVLAGWTGIPLGNMLKDELATVLSLDKHLQGRVIGQDHAMSAIAKRILTSRASMEDPVKPQGVFLLVGPSGVGKTETAIVLAELLYGGERNMITINMSEFQEAHTVSTLKGSPPGYIGYGEGGVLTEAVRRRPYSVVLLDEVEKAHPDVLELFFQVFDKGRMEDGEGREIDFRNTIILLTSNAASGTLMKLAADPETMPNQDGMLAALRPELNTIFKPAFLGRLQVIPYFPVRDEVLRQIIRLKLGKIERRMLATHRIRLGWDSSLIETIAGRCTEVESGARNVDNILSNTMLPELSREILGLMAEGRLVEGVQVSADDGVLRYAWSEPQ